MRFARSVPRDFRRQAAGGNALQARQEGPQQAQRVEVMLCPCRALRRLVLRLAHHGRQAKKNRLWGRFGCGGQFDCFQNGGLFLRVRCHGAYAVGGLLASDAPSP